MQLKFITLTLSAVLALSALSVNALPTGEPTGQDIAPQSESKDVSHGSQACVPGQNNGNELSGLGGVAGLVESLLNTVENLLKTVTDDLLKNVLNLVKELLVGSCNKQGVVEELLEAVKGLLKDDKPGKFADAKNAGPQEPHTPASDDNDNVVDAIISLVNGLLGGDSAKESGAEAVISLLEGILNGILGQKNDSGAKHGSTAGPHGADGNQRDEFQ